MLDNVIAAINIGTSTTVVLPKQFILNLLLQKLWVNCPDLRPIYILNTDFKICLKFR